MSSCIYQYKTPALGGAVAGNTLYLSFPFWGVQAINLSSNEVSSTWLKPSSKHQFSAVVECIPSSSDTGCTLLSAVFDASTNANKFLCWNSADMKIKSKQKFKSLKLLKNEAILRIFKSKMNVHLQPLIVTVTSFGRIFAFNLKEKTFDLLVSGVNINKKSNVSGGGGHIVSVKFHDSFSRILNGNSVAPLPLQNGNVNGKPKKKAVIINKRCQISIMYYPLSGELTTTNKSNSIQNKFKIQKNSLKLKVFEFQFDDNSQQLAFVHDFFLGIPRHLNFRGYGFLSVHEPEDQENNSNRNDDGDNNEDIDVDVDMKMEAVDGDGDGKNSKSGAKEDRSLLLNESNGQKEGKKIILDEIPIPTTKLTGIQLEIANDTKGNKHRENSRLNQVILDYDWCLDSNHLLLLTNDGQITCLKYSQLRSNAKNAIVDADANANANAHIGSVSNKFEMIWNVNCNEYFYMVRQRNQFDNTPTTETRRLHKNNQLFAVNDTSVFNYYRIQFLERSQFMIIGPDLHSSHNALKICTFHQEFGYLKEEYPLLMPMTTAENNNNKKKLLMIAPLIIEYPANQPSIINVLVVTSKSVHKITLPSFGQSLLDLVSYSLQNEQLKAIQMYGGQHATEGDISFVGNDNHTEANGEASVAMEEEEEEEEEEQSMSNASMTDGELCADIHRVHHFIENEDWNDCESFLLSIENRKNNNSNNSKNRNGTVVIKELDIELFNLMLEKLVLSAKWDFIQRYLNELKEISEKDVLAVLSMLLSCLQYFRNDVEFIRLLHFVLSIDFNDIFMKRMLQILPGVQIDLLVGYLYETLKSGCLKSVGSDVSLNTILIWLNIVLDTYFYASKSKNEYWIEVKHYLDAFTQSQFQELTQVSAQIHQILYDVKAQRNKNRKMLSHFRNGTETQELSEYYSVEYLKI